MPYSSPREWFHTLPITARLFVAYVSLAVVAPGLAAQQARSSIITLAGGPSFYSFGSAEEPSETGSGLIVAASATYAFTSLLLTEASIGYFQYTPEWSSVAQRSLFPEVGVRFSSRSGALRPYIGVGAGLVIYLDRGTGATFHGVLGTQVRLSDDWNVRGELRGRWEVPFHGWADFTLGVGWTL